MHERPETTVTGRTPLESVLREFNSHAEQLLKLTLEQADALRDEDYRRLSIHTERKEQLWTSAVVVLNALQARGVSFADPAAFAGSPAERAELLAGAALLGRIQAMEKFNLRTAFQHEQLAGRRLGELVGRRTVMKRYEREPGTRSTINMQG